MIYHKWVYRYFKCDSVAFVSVKKKWKFLYRRNTVAKINNIIRYGGLPFCRKNVCDSTNSKISKVPNFEPRQSCSKSVIYYLSNYLIIVRWTYILYLMKLSGSGSFSDKLTVQS